MQVVVYRWLGGVEMGIVMSIFRGSVRRAGGAPDPDAELDDGEESAADKKRKAQEESAAGQPWRLGQR